MSLYRSSPFQIEERVELKEQIVKTSVVVQDLILPGLTATEREILYQLGNWHVNIAHYLKNTVYNYEMVNITENEISDFLLEFYRLYKHQKKGGYTSWPD